MSRAFDPIRDPLDLLEITDPSLLSDTELHDLKSLVRPILVTDEPVPHDVHNRLLGIAPLAWRVRDYLLKLLEEIEREQERREKPRDP
jgi:hypothetical protein